MHGHLGSLGISRSKRAARTILLTVLSLVALATPAQAYIDPGTAGAVFSSLGYLLALGGAMVGILLWPLRRLIGSIRRKKTQDSGEPEG